MVILFPSYIRRIALKNTFFSSKNPRLYHSTQAQKNTLPSAPEASFFKISKIELNELKIYYSTPKTSAPVYFNSITYQYRQDSEHELDLKGHWQENPLSAKVLINLVSSYPVIKADINFANNTLNLIAQSVDNSYQLQTNIRINNPVPLANLFSIKDDELPQQVHSVFKVLGNQLIIPAFDAINPSARLEATLGPDGSNSYITNITLHEDLLLKFSGTTLTHCPLPQPVKAFIKGMNTKIRINFTKASQEKSTLILIDGSGIHFEGSSLPEVVQKNFQTCFDYQLEDESMQTTYTIN
ncbi:hypothetical protein [Legionella sp. km772]|uniref:hypothetical protein n=1 Tax=Legionella sp. km772 TaxID=2498111 RepID=UPI000F8EA61D|nr:hypothetical protein [Legionella sp. km772]RUR05047.1 hypothetical protein ELY15_14805 [Legionella sp. km772]